MHPNVGVAGETAVYRLRFINFNMANSSGCGDLDGPFEATFKEPFPDGANVDLAFATLAETRHPVSDWCKQLQADSLDTVVSHNARRASANDGRYLGQRLLEKVARRYNGNLKTILAFSSQNFEEDTDSMLFGRLIERKVAGLAVPNPKKSFIGRTVKELSHGVRLCFVGTHFPIGGVRAAIDEVEQPGDIASVLRSAKIALAKSLRQVLRGAVRSNILCSNTILVIQGDLNSRTLLDPSGGSPRDVLLELIGDTCFQAAIQKDLNLPPGRWHEIASCKEAYHLPVTYKFTDCPGSFFRRQDPRPHGQLGPGTHLSLGDVFAETELVRRTMMAFHEEEPLAHLDSDLYRRTMMGIPGEQLEAWGLQFKEAGFRPFRFPASPDRTIYWVPDVLASRIAWSLPHGGYKVCHHQHGSDHRPVSLEAVLHVAPHNMAAAAAAEAAAEATTRLQVLAHRPESQLESGGLCQSDNGESDSEH
mmetsp:Transcript_34359/g.66464  ORF Transcript_34359/g.66464 Transcript_34359/m.66464 type:complete len:476 (+) Transcript_34359:163-1590(+)